MLGGSGESAKPSLGGGSYAGNPLADATPQGMQ